MATDTQESSADIIAEMRTKAECAKPYDDGIVMMLTDYADRLEAARKREVDKFNSAIQATVGRSDAEIDRLRREIAEMRQAGDAAKLREVCEQFLELLAAPAGFEDGMSVELDEEQVDMWRNRFRAALAARPRNCDVGSAKEQYHRFCLCCTKHKMPCRRSYTFGCAECYANWVQMPYEEGGAK